MTGIGNVLRVLLVEDNELDARAMTRSLSVNQDTPFEITRAVDLATAEAELAAHAYDCMLLDLSLPDSEGIVSVQSLAATAPDCPIVVLTGLDDPSTAIEAVEQGAQDYLSKNSVDPEMVARAVRYAVARHHGELALRSATDQLNLMHDRERIARDLHDTVIQQLFATGMGLQALAATITDPEAKDRLRTSIDGIDAAIHQLREAIFGLHAVPQHLAFGQTIAALVDDKAESLGFQPLLEVGPMPDDLTEELRHETSQVISEALANIIKHAEASATRVVVAVEKDALVVTVTDNGRGVNHLMDGGNIQNPTAAARALTGRGLQNMEKRAEDLGGSFHLGPGAGGGTRIEWRVPLG
jgi:signal transduction histidine kinase